MDYAAVIAGVSIVVAFLTFLSTQFSLSRTASEKRVDTIDRRLDECLKAKVEMETELRRLREENIVYMRAALGLDKLGGKETRG